MNKKTWFEYRQKGVAYGDDRNPIYIFTDDDHNPRGLPTGFRWSPDFDELPTKKQYDTVNVKKHLEESSAKRIKAVIEAVTDEYSRLETAWDSAGYDIDNVVVKDTRIDSYVLIPRRPQDS